MILKLIWNPITSSSSCFLSYLNVEPIVIHLLKNCMLINLMEIQKAINILLFDLEEHHDISSPIHLIFHNLLKELLNHLDVILCLLVENLCNGHCLLILTNFLNRHSRQSFNCSLINLRSNNDHAWFCRSLIIILHKLNQLKVLIELIHDLLLENHDILEVFVEVDGNVFVFVFHWASIFFNDTIFTWHIKISFITSHFLILGTRTLSLLRCWWYVILHLLLFFLWKFHFVVDHELEIVWRIVFGSVLHFDFNFGFLLSLAVHCFMHGLCVYIVVGAWGWSPLINVYTFNQFTVLTHSQSLSWCALWSAYC